MMYLIQAFRGDAVPKKGVHYTCIACISIDSIMKIERKNYPQVYLEECKYKIKKKNLVIFIDAELDLIIASEKLDSE